MSAIFLMDGPTDARIIFLVFIGNLRGPILGGTVVHDQDLHLIAAGQQGVDAVSHIGF